MFTQCAHCLTLFRITPEQLKAAAGQVRCCQCNQTFNALENLHESPMPFTTQPEGEPLPDGELAAEDKLIYYPPQQDEHSSLLINDSEVERSLDDLADDSTPIPSLTDDSNLDSDDPNLLKESSQLFYEQDDGLETEPDYYASGTESQMSELLDKDSA
ncbi:MAG: zinc-ribbon domain-containing protein, partial [Candidatus Thiodiazotropha taylori]|nr:zinc-ribbon domain-containing protein [Candidatus Thiodiazotropha taylori]